MSVAETQDRDAPDPKLDMHGRLEARGWSVLAIALLIYLATQVSHTPS
jgi:hypothetical protein